MGVGKSSAWRVWLSSGNGKWRSGNCIVTFDIRRGGRGGVFDMQKELRVDVIVILLLENLFLFLFRVNDEVDLLQSFVLWWMGGVGGSKRQERRKWASHNQAISQSWLIYKPNKDEINVPNANEEDAPWLSPPRCWLLLSWYFREEPQTRRHHPLVYSRRMCSFIFSLHSEQRVTQ